MKTTTKPVFPELNSKGQRKCAGSLWCDTAAWAEHEGKWYCTRCDPIRAERLRARGIPVCEATDLYGGCDKPGKVERDGKWYCKRHDPALPLCCERNGTGAPCRGIGRYDVDGRLYCGHHAPPEVFAERRAAEEAKLKAKQAENAERLRSAEEKDQIAADRDRVNWAEQTAIADAQGIRVYLIREDHLMTIVELLSRLPYVDVYRILKMIESLPPAPVAGRWRVLQDALAETGLQPTLAQDGIMKIGDYLTEFVAMR